MQYEIHHSSLKIYWLCLLHSFLVECPEFTGGNKFVAWGHYGQDVCLNVKFTGSPSPEVTYHFLHFYRDETLFYDVQM